MSSMTKNTAERNHVGTDGLSYAFSFEIPPHRIPTCDYCGGRYPARGIPVSMECGLEICPSCLLAGPQAVAKRLKGRRGFAVAAGVFERLSSFSQLPGGSVALRIARRSAERRSEWAS